MFGKTSQSGQSALEYILLMAIIATVAIGFMRALNETRFVDVLARPIKQDFARAYQYGSPRVVGFDEGGPENHPRVNSSGNFRIFINPTER